MDVPDANVVYRSLFLFSDLTNTDVLDTNVFYRFFFLFLFDSMDGFDANGVHSPFKKEKLYKKETISMYSMLIFFYRFFCFNLSIMVVLDSNVVHRSVFFFLI